MSRGYRKKLQILPLNTEYHLFRLGNTGEYKRAYEGKYRLGQHIRAVIAQRIEHGAVDPLLAECDEFTRLRPEDDACRKMAEESDDAYHKYPCKDAGSAFFAEKPRKAQKGKGDHVVEEQRTDEYGGSQTPAENAAGEYLQPRIAECRAKSPAQAVTDGDEHDGKHTERCDRPAEGHLPNLKYAEHGGKCHHYRALNERSCLCVHFLEPPENKNYRHDTSGNKEGL